MKLRTENKAKTQSPSACLVVVAFVRYNRFGSSDDAAPVPRSSAATPSAAAPATKKPAKPVTHASAPALLAQSLDPTLRLGPL